MKLEIGMYIRTKTGIAKITDIICGQDVKFDNDNIFEDDDLKQHHRYDGISANGYFFTHDVVKVSNNIIDLIQVGDYVNGSKVIDIVENDVYVSNFYEEQCIGQVSKKNIKSIVTKEQIESIKYEVK